MEQHVRNLATLSVVFGVLSGVAALAVLLYFGGFGTLWVWAEATGGLGPLATGTVLFHLLVSVPMILGGLFLKQFRDAARYFMVVLCALNLLNPPFGSLLGGYGLWVLFMPETEPLFLDPAVRRNRAIRPPQ
jgi:hypothetical protein